MQTLIDVIVNEHDKVLYFLAALALIVELTVIGLSGPLLFFSIGCFITAILISLQIIIGLEMEILCVGLFSLLSAFILWKPLKRIQGKGIAKDNSSDLIGQVVLVSETVTTASGKVRHSGINWTARLDSSEQQALDAGQQAMIVGVEGNILMVKAVKA